MRDVNNGWLIRYLHSNTASAFFFLVYLHIGRGLYYGSYRAPRTLVWTIGTVIFILMIVTAFLGLLHSPKWFKFNNNNKNNKIFSSVNHNSNSENKPHFYLARPHVFAKVKQISIIGRRYFSTSSIRDFTVTFPLFFFLFFIMISKLICNNFIIIKKKGKKKAR
jgi:hypothetical protein